MAGGLAQLARGPFCRKCAGCKAGPDIAKGQHAVYDLDQHLIDCGETTFALSELLA